MALNRTNPKLAKHSIHVMFGMDELNRLAAGAVRNKMSKADYIRMLVARDWSDYRTREQEALEWLLEGKGHEPSVKLEDLTDRQTE